VSRAAETLSFRLRDELLELKVTYFKVQRNWHNDTLCNWQHYAPSFRVTSHIAVVTRGYRVWQGTDTRTPQGILDSAEKFLIDISLVLSLKVTRRRSVFRRVRIVAKTPITFVMTVSLSSRLLSCMRASLAGRISVKCDIENFYENLSRKYNFS
jgi:hypothetical protein